MSESLSPDRRRGWVELVSLLLVFGVQVAVGSAWIGGLEEKQKGLVVAVGAQATEIRILREKLTELQTDRRRDDQILRLTAQVAALESTINSLREEMRGRR